MIGPDRIGVVHEDAGNPQRTELVFWKNSLDKMVRLVIGVSVGWNPF